MQVYVSFNQLEKREVPKARAMKIDGAWLVPSNSPDITMEEWQSIAKKRVVLEQGGLDRNWLFNPTWPAPAPVIRGEVERYGKNPNYVMVYHEDQNTPAPWTRPTLTPEDLALSYEALKRPIIPLYRTYNKQVLTKSLTVPGVMGGCYEFGPDVGMVRRAQVYRWVDAVISLKKTPFFLIPPLLGDRVYENDVVECLKYLYSKTKNLLKVRVVLAIYSREHTHVPFFGRKNSVEAAVKKIKETFK